MSALGPQTTQPKDTLEMCKQHLDTFAIAARSLECFGLGQRPRRVTSLLVDTSRDSAEGGLWAALRLEYVGRHIAGRPKCRVIKRGEILFGRAAHRLCIK